jgi:hypothetical protein
LARDLREIPGLLLPGCGGNLRTPDCVKSHDSGYRSLGGVTMRSLIILATLALSAGVLSGCTTASGGATGALVGGLTGAGIGVIAGDPTAGALLGTGLGLGFGSMVGSANEDLARRQGWAYDDVWGSTGHYAYPAYGYYPAPNYATVSYPPPTQYYAPPTYAYPAPAYPACPVPGYGYAAFSYGGHF